MILPRKHLHPRRALLGLGATVLAQLDEPRTVSELWERVRSASAGSDTVTFDWYIMTLTFLFSVSAITLQRGRTIARCRQ
jgi:hypothetical protein